MSDSSPIFTGLDELCARMIPGIARGAAVSPPISTRRVSLDIRIPSRFAQL
jgi:hypothetical protein